MFVSFSTYISQRKISKCNIQFMCLFAESFQELIYTAFIDIADYELC